MDPLQQIVDEYKLEEFFYNDIVDISSRVIEEEITKPTSLSDMEVLEQICKNLPPTSSAGVNSTSTERLNKPQLVEYSDSSTGESDTDDDESSSQQNNIKSVAIVEISSSEDESASANKMGLIQLENISNNTSEDEMRHDVVVEQSRKRKLTKKRSTPIGDVCVCCQCVCLCACVCICVCNCECLCVSPKENSTGSSGADTTDVDSDVSVTKERGSLKKSKFIYS